jgi:hypothetical protein
MSRGPTTHIEKLARLVRMLGSSEEHEVVAAFRTRKRTLERAGESFSDLGDRVERSGRDALSVSEDEMKRIDAAGFPVGVKQVENQHHGDRAFRELSNIELSRNAEMARFCWQHEATVAAGAGFRRGDGDRNRQRRSPKQVAWCLAFSAD